MKKQHIKSAVIQMMSKPRDLEANLRKAEGLICQAAQEGAEIVVLPGLFNIGYGTISHRKRMQYAETIEGTTSTYMKELAARYHIHLCGAILEKDGKKLYDTMLFATPDRLVYHSRKTNLPLHEQPFLKRGRKPGIVETSLGKIGLAICWDIVSDDLVHELESVDLVVVSSAWPQATRPFRYYNKLATNRNRLLSEKLGVPVLYANHCGPVEYHVPFFTFFAPEFLGKSCIIKPNNNSKSLNKEESILLSEN